MNDEDNSQDMSDYDEEDYDEIAEVMAFYEMELQYRDRQLDEKDDLVQKLSEELAAEEEELKERQKQLEQKDVIIHQLKEALESKGTQTPTHTRNQEDCNLWEEDDNVDWAAAAAIE